MKKNTCRIFRTNDDFFSVGLIESETANLVGVLKVAPLWEFIDCSLNFIFVILWIKLPPAQLRRWI